MHYGRACWHKLLLTVVLIKNENLPLGFCVSFILRCLLPVVLGSWGHFRCSILHLQSINLLAEISQIIAQLSVLSVDVCLCVRMSLLHCLSFCRPRLAFCLLAKKPRPSDRQSSLNKLSNRNSCASLKVKNEAAKDGHFLTPYPYSYIFLAVFWQLFAMPD